MADTIIFDLETKRLADEVGGWSNIDKMGFAAGVTCHVRAGLYHRFVEDDIQDLIDTLVVADRIIGFNLIRFDYTVLKPYGLQVNQQLLDKSVDLLLDIYAVLGFRVGLGNLAEATLNESKSADGVLSVQWYRAGQIQKVLDYCEQDVRVTKDLWQFGCDHGYVFYRNRRGGKSRVPVPWASTSSDPSA